MPSAPRNRPPPQPPLETRPQRRIQGLANAAFLRVHEAAKAMNARPIEEPLDLVEAPPPLDLVAPVETPLDLVAPEMPLDLVTPDMPLDLVTPEMPLDLTEPSAPLELSEPVMPLAPDAPAALEAEFIAPSLPPAADESQAAKARSRVAERLARLAGQTASRTKEATSSALQASRTGVAQAAKAGRERLLPQLRERTKPERIAADYRAFLIWLHANVLDTSFEKLVFKKTAESVPLDGLTIESQNRSQGHDYKATPTFVFKWALAGIGDDLSRFNFVDYGAGKGRVLLLASQHPFAAISGIEFAAELHDDARMNIAQFSRSGMKCRNVECTHGDAADMKPLEGEAVHYFFNPFEPGVFAEILNGIVASYHEKPRRLYLILVDMDEAERLHRTGVFQEVELPAAERYQARMLSPYKINVYRSLA